MLALYHFGGAICAQKVRLALAEKGVPWESRVCEGPALRDPAYLKLNPSGVVPTLVHEDTVLTESRIISEYVNEAFEGPSLMPDEPQGRYRARRWSKQIDDSLHLNVFILSFAGVMREIFMGMPPEIRARAMPGLQDPIKRQIASDLLEHGWDARWVAMAAERFRRLLTEMEAQLAQAPYLASHQYSLADADFTAYLNRLNDLGLAGLWAEKPAVADWWARVRTRPSYEAAILQWETSQDAARYQHCRESNARTLERLVAPV